MKTHLTELINANSVLLEQMEKYCGDDHRVQKILHDKVNRLELSCEKVKTHSEAKYEKKFSFLKDRINESKLEGK